MNKEEKKSDKPRCPYCQGKFNYIRIKDNQLVCRTCGKISDLNKK